MVWRIPGHQRHLHHWHDCRFRLLPGHPLWRHAGLANAPVEFATSVVSFERVFEVIDLPLDIIEEPDAVALDKVSRPAGILKMSLSNMRSMKKYFLNDVRRYGQQCRSEARCSLRPGKASPLRKVMPEEPGPRICPQGYQFQRLNLASWSPWSDPAAPAKPLLTYLIPGLYDSNRRPHPPGRH